MVFRKVLIYHRTANGAGKTPRQEQCVSLFVTLYIFHQQMSLGSKSDSSNINKPRVAIFFRKMSWLAIFDEAIKEKRPNDALEALRANS